MLESGARHALIGPNGAGKTTFVNLLTGVLKPTAGTIIARRRRHHHASPSHRRVRRGLVRTFQINQLFAELTPLASRSRSRSRAQRGAERAAGGSRSAGPTRVAADCERLLDRFRPAPT